MKRMDVDAMTRDYKAGVIKAMENNHAKQLKKEQGPQRKNEAPEKEVEKQVLEYLRDQGWFLNVVESKATFNPKLQRYISGQAKSGFPDVIGCTPMGKVVALELKAQGRRSTLRDEQREFLLEVISRGGFAAVVDSVDRLKYVIQKYKDNQVPTTLLDLLPAVRQSAQSDLIFDET